MLIGKLKFSQRSVLSPFISHGSLWSQVTISCMEAAKTEQRLFMFWPLEIRNREKWLKHINLPCFQYSIFQRVNFPCFHSHDYVCLGWSDCYHLYTPSIVKQSLLQSISNELLAGFLILVSQTRAPMSYLICVTSCSPTCQKGFFLYGFYSSIYGSLCLTCTRILCHAWMLSLLPIISTLKNWKQKPTGTPDSDSHHSRRGKTLWSLQSEGTELLQFYVFTVMMFSSK